MHARIYDFTLGAGGMLRLPVVGDFFKVISSTGQINVNADTGATLDLMPGQGLREFNFNTLTISDKSGAANSGKILVGFSGMIDDRVTGEVSVIDGGRSRSISGSAFIANLYCAAVAGQFAHAQLWNPAGSGRRAIVSKLQVGSSVAGSVKIGFKNAALSTLYAAPNPSSKRSGGAVVSILEQRTENAVAPLVTTQASAFNPASSMVLFDFDEPIIIEPGWGWGVIAGAVNADILGIVEVFEEPV